MQTSELELDLTAPADLARQADLGDDDAGTGGVEAAVPTHAAGFVLLVLVTAVMFLRPSELLPALQAVPIYEPLILSCLIASYALVLGQLRWESLSAHPVTFCVVAMCPCVLISNASHGDYFRARTGATDFLKLVLYYLLIVGLVSSEWRFRRFVVVMVAFILGIASLALLHHHGVVHLDALDAMEQLEGVLDENGERVLTVRLQASGIFNDPNDFALILVAGVLICTHIAFETSGWLARLPFLLPLPVFMYAFAMTRSRGGFLSLLAGLAVMGVSRFGWRRAMLIGFFTLPVIVVAFGGRQTRISFSDEDDTGHARVEIWAEALDELRTSPVFGIGYGAMSRDVGIVAHNSFVHAFTELGLIGGTLFLGAFYISVTHIRRLRGGAAPDGDADVADDEEADADADADEFGDRDDLGDHPDEAAEPAETRGPPVLSELARWRPCVLAVLVAYGVGLCALSRAYTVTTYLILGVAGAYFALTAAPRDPDAPTPLATVAPKLIRVAICFMVGLYLFVRVVT